MKTPIYTLRVIWACMKKDIASALTEPTTTAISVILPVNFLILFSLFAVGGGLAPTAVVLQDRGPYAQQFYDAMAHAHSFRLQQANASEAHNLIQEGRIVAVITVPADFDTRIQYNQPVQVDVEVNNLNTDFANDIRRAVPLSITSFYAKAFPNVVTTSPIERDFYPQDTGYIPYLTVSVLVMALMITGLLRSGTGVAQEWENSTIKALLLSPASRWAMIVGKMLGALAVSLISAVLVLAILVLVIGVWPVHWIEVLGFTLLILTIFIALGTLLGTLLKQRQAFTGLAYGIAVPLFFVSGAFGPISFGVPVTQVIAQIFPVYYAIVLLQHAFHGFDLNTYGVGINVLILLGYASGLMLLASIILRRSTIVS